MVKVKFQKYPLPVTYIYYYCKYQKHLLIYICMTRNTVDKEIKTYKFKSALEI